MVTGKETEMGMVLVSVAGMVVEIVMGMAMVTEMATEILMVLVMVTGTVVEIVMVMVMVRYLPPELGGELSTARAITACVGTSILVTAAGTGGEFFRRLRRFGVLSITFTFTFSS